MGSDRFDVDELKHILRPGSSAAKIDWGNEEHRRCMVACMVKGAYVLESDRAMGRTEAAALAPAWWESFHFRLNQKLTDGRSIYGAIYEHVAGPRHPAAPRYVVAFRGTMLKNPDRKVMVKDVILDVNILTNTLKYRTRSKRARGAVEGLMADPARSNPDREECADVWLAGHSLGASLALDVGRNMIVEWGLNLPTFLFNPPQVSLTPVLNLLKATDKAKSGLHLTSFVWKVAAGRFSDSHRENMGQLFKKLEPWVLNLYVHDKDWICQGFIDYFELRQKYRERFPDAGTVWMTISYRDMLSRLFGEETGQPHLLPSATLWKSRLETDAHGLQQWWKPDRVLELGAKSYSYTT
ncbi:GDSL esterase/lipase At4g10955-like [Aegilops tauschii subsp. strangulata]|uniref:Fungal lipase-like domain-containing protein n=2 Tax=Aegilops tauschii TaxID=37682 RepID=A0A453LUH4_AEGTS|nr:GDSL esterase/lipase At4g10955-like [Aegilops tauschii subsp. strangulata]